MVVIADGRLQAIDEPVNLLDQSEWFRGVIGVSEGARARGEVADAEPQPYGADSDPQEGSQ